MDVNTHTHAHTHARTHACMHARTHARTHKNKQNNKRVIVTSSVWENLSYSGSLNCYSFGNKTTMWVVRKVRTVILLADLVCFEVQCLPRSAHLKFPKMSSFWWRRFKMACTFLSFLFLFYFLASASSCSSSSSLKTKQKLSTLFIRQSCHLKMSEDHPNLHKHVDRAQHKL